MPNSSTPVYLHYVWTTEGRRPLIPPDWEASLHACIAAKCRELGCLTAQVNGMADHVHVLVKMSPDHGYATLAKEMKGSSSYLINHCFAPDAGFLWQPGYYCCGVDPDCIDQIHAYIRDQKRHHADNSVNPAWERTEE